MKLADAVREFDQWSSPWTFSDTVRTKLGESSPESKMFDDLEEEAHRPEHWQTADSLQAGSRKAFEEIKRKFPEIDDTTIDSIVNAASYQWR